MHGAGVRLAFRNMTALQQTWGWLRGPMQDTLFPATPFYGGKANYSDIADHMVLGQYALVGAVRIKMWRVQPNATCAPMLPSFEGLCFGPLNGGDHADTSPFGPKSEGGDIPGFSVAESNVTRHDAPIDGRFGE